MKHWETIKTEETQGFHLVCSVAYEDIHPRDCFDDSIDDIAEICRKIDNGTYVWFVVRVEAFKHGILLGSDYLGACLYENFKQFLEDGSYEDLVSMAIQDAKANLSKLQEVQHETI